MAGSKLGSPNTHCMPRSLPRLASSLVIFFAWSAIGSSAFGQSSGSDLIYKFSVQGIQDRAAAKVVQYALMEHAFSTSCDYIEECTCFKLGVNAAIDYVTLKNILQDNGHVLTGEILLSNGTVLHPPHSGTEER